MIARGPRAAKTVVFYSLELWPTCDYIGASCFLGVTGCDEVKNVEYVTGLTTCKNVQYASGSLWTNFLAWAWTAPLTMHACKYIYIYICILIHTQAPPLPLPPSLSPYVHICCPLPIYKNLYTCSIGARSPGVTRAEAVPPSIQSYYSIAILLIWLQ